MESLVSFYSGFQSFDIYYAPTSVMIDAREIKPHPIDKGC